MIRKQTAKGNGRKEVKKSKVQERGVGRIVHHNVHSYEETPKVKRKEPSFVPARKEPCTPKVGGKSLLLWSLSRTRAPSILSRYVSILCIILSFALFIALY